MNESDEDLMLSYQGGDEAAFEVLYERYSKRVYGFLKKRLNTSFQVDEVFQAVFLKLHQSRRQFDPKYKFAPWLFTICRTVLIDAARTKKIYFDPKFEQLGEIEAPQSLASTSKMDLGGLPPTDSEALRMRYLEEMSFEEMAQKLGVSSPTIRKRVSRALTRLKKQWVKS